MSAHGEYLAFLAAGEYRPPRQYQPHGRHSYPVALHDPDSSSFDDLPMGADGELHEPTAAPRHREVTA